MGLPIAPILIGAGVGALGGAVTGNNPLKTALLGAALGTGAGALGAAGTAGTATSVGTGLTAVPTTAASFEASMGLPSSALIEAGAPLASAMPLSTASGLVQGASGNLINPEYYSNILGNQVYNGGEGVLSNAVGQITPTVEDLKRYATIDNLKGAQQIASQFQPKPFSTPQSGHITQGQSAQGGLGQGGVEGLLAELKKQQFERQPISLLVG